MSASFRSAALAVTAMLLASATASAQDKTFYVAGYGGSFEQTMRKEIIPAFEQKHGVKVEYIAGNSTDTLAKLQAQKANQQIDVAIVDDGPMYQAIALGFCAPIKGLAADDIVQAARYKEDRAVGVGLVGTGFMYNTKAFAEKGWAPPASWNDLKDPKYKKVLVIPPLNNTYGLHTLVMMARLHGGDEKNIEPGFKVFKEQVGPSVLVYEPSPGKMTELFQSGQAIVAIWGSGRVKAFADTGFPVEFVYPKEGAVTLLSSACPIAKPNASPLAHEFVKALVEPRIQEVFAKEYGYGPVNKKAVVSPESARMAPVGERADKLLLVDWDTINTKRDEWNKRWTREIER